MATPHKCPICNGTGKVRKLEEYCGPYDTTTTYPRFDFYVSCRACNGSGILWEPVTEIPNLHYPPSLPSFPETPIPGTYIPPVVLSGGLQWPESFEFPKDIQDSSTKKIISMLEGWLKDLKASKRKATKKVRKK